jgi:hypothetical protein
MARGTHRLTRVSPGPFYALWADHQKAAAVSTLLNNPRRTLMCKTVPVLVNLVASYFQGKSQKWVIAKMRFLPNRSHPRSDAQAPAPSSKPPHLRYPLYFRSSPSRPPPRPFLSPPPPLHKYLVDLLHFQLASISSCSFKASAPKKMRPKALIICTFLCIFFHMCILYLFEPSFNCSNCFLIATVFSISF